MHLDDRHPGSGLVEIDVVDDRPGLVRLDELDQLTDRRLQLVEPAFSDLGRVDRDDRPGP
jgi:hypothetical protein